MYYRARIVLLLIVGVYAQAALKSATDDYPPDANPRYFPVGVFAEGKADGDFRARWYAQQLRALEEPTLDKGASDSSGPVYRFTWLRTFHHPITVRIAVHPTGAGTLTAKMADGAGGYEPGNLIANDTREISVKEVQYLLKLIHTMDFWEMPTEPPAPANFVNLDGAQWILECSRNGAYHVVDRWSPRKGALRKLGLYLALKLGKLDVSPNTIY